MTTLALVLHLIALGCFVAATFNVPSSSRVNLIAVGLAAWVTSTMV
jgi:hypothetical protein